MTERDILAAEMALRLLEGQELVEAENLARTDPAFSAAVADWEIRLAPLAEEIGPARPSAEVWQRIERAISSGAISPNVVLLKRKLRAWQIGAIASAVAACAALFLLTVDRQSPPAPVVQPASTKVLVASLASEAEPASVAITYLPQTRSLIIVPGRLKSLEQRATELWVIPAGKPPVSLGLIQADALQRKVLTAQLSSLMVSGSTLAVSDEPAGGSPIGQPTGAVLAAGQISEG